MIVFTIPSFISILFTTLSYFFIERKNLNHQKENNTIPFEKQMPFIPFTSTLLIPKTTNPTAGGPDDDERKEGEERAEGQTHSTTPIPKGKPKKTWRLKFSRINVKEEPKGKKKQSDTPTEHTLNQKKLFRTFIIVYYIAKHLKNKQRTKNTKKRNCTSTRNYTGIRNSYRYEIDQSQIKITPYSILWHITINHKQVATYIQKMRGSPTCFKEVASHSTFPPWLLQNTTFITLMHGILKPQDFTTR